MINICCCCCCCCCTICCCCCCPVFITILCLIPSCVCTICGRANRFCPLPRLMIICCPLGPCCCWNCIPPGLDSTRLPANCGRCCGDVIRDGDANLAESDGDGEGPPPALFALGLNGLSSICGVPIRGDDCIVLYGDMAFA